jgi:hypothetical protein
VLNARVRSEAVAREEQSKDVLVGAVDTGTLQAARNRTMKCRVQVYTAERYLQPSNSKYGMRYVTTSLTCNCVSMIGKVG